MSKGSEGSFVLAAGKSSASPICINCIGKMLLWGHVCGIIELLLNNYLGHFLIIEKKIYFSFHVKCNKDNTLLHANIQMPWCTECNRSNRQCPKCFYEPESPGTTSKSGQLKLLICNIHLSYRWMCFHAGSDKSAAHWNSLGVPKGLQAITQFWIVN